MKPIDLTPATRASESPGGGSQARQMLGVGVGLLAVLGVSAYFMLARVNSVNEEARGYETEVASITSNQTKVQNELRDLGQKPSVVGWSTVADTYTKDVVERVSGADDYGRLLRDLASSTAAVSNTWISDVKAGSVSSDGASSAASPTGGQSITISGYAPTVTAVMSLINNLNAAPSISRTKLSSVKIAKTRSGAPFRQFDLTAQFSSKMGGSVGADGLVSSGSLDVALDAKPKVRARPKVKAKQSSKVARPPATPPADLVGFDGLAQDTSSAGKRGSA